MGWVSQELAELELGDLRRELRLMEMIEQALQAHERELARGFW